MTSDLEIGVDASHYQDPIDRALLRTFVRYAYVKASQGDNFTDPHAAANLATLEASYRAGEIDWYGAYHWPSTAAPADQAALFERIVAEHTDTDGWRWVIDCEGGTVFDLDQLAKSFGDRFGPERGIIYGGAFLIGSLGNPTPAQAPHAAAAGGFIRAAYVNDQPGHGVNVVPKLYAGKGPTFWQYSNGKSGPDDRDRFPRTVDGFTGDMDCFWQPTAGTTYDEWVARTGGGMFTPNYDQASTLLALADAFGDADINGDGKRGDSLVNQTAGTTLGYVREQNGVPVQDDEGPYTAQGRALYRLSQSQPAPGLPAHHHDQAGTTGPAVAD